MPVSGRAIDRLDQVARPRGSSRCVRTGIGTGWVGCGMEGMYARPAALDVDYGHPIGDCKETSAGSEVFTRDFSKATVQMDCKAWQGTITMK